MFKKKHPLSLGDRVLIGKYTLPFRADYWLEVEILEISPNKKYFLIKELSREVPYFRGRAPYWVEISEYTIGDILPPALSLTAIPRSDS